MSFLRIDADIDTSPSGYSVKCTNAYATTFDTGNPVAWPYGKAGRTDHAAGKYCDQTDCSLVGIGKGCRSVAIQGERQERLAISVAFARLRVPYHILITLQPMLAGDVERVMQRDGEQTDPGLTNIAVTIMHKNALPALRSCLRGRRS